MGRPSKYKFDHDVVVDLIQRQKLSIPLAAKELNCSYNSLREYVKRNNIEQPKDSIKSSTSAIEVEDSDTVQEMLNDKKTFKQIAETLGCTESSVANFVKKHNLTVRRYNSLPDEKTLRHLYCDKLLRLSDIANMYGVSSSRVADALKKYRISRTAEEEMQFKNKTAERISASINDRTLSKLHLPPLAELHKEVCDVGITKISSKYNITLERLRSMLTENGYDIPNMLSPIDKDRLQELLDDGLTFKEMSKVLKKSEVTISKYVKQYGLDRSEKGKELVSRKRSEISRSVTLLKYNSRLPTYDELQELINEYKNFHEIADIYGCSDSVIGSCVSRYSITFPKDYDEVVVSKYINKGKQTIVDRYGVFPYALSKYSKEAQDTLTDKDKLEKFLMHVDEKDRTLARCASDLNIPEYLLQSYINKYGIEVKFANKLGSSLEEMLRKVIDNWNVSYTRNTRKIISPKELDFYFPDKNLAIEINGNWSHSTTSSGKYVPITKDYHKSKTLACKEKSIRLIHLFEYDMSNANKWHKIQRFLHDVICEPARFAYARKLTVKEVDTSVEREFLDYNHLQGYIGSRACLGLYDGDELVMLMSFGKPRYNKTCEWELLRLCTKHNVAVIGGAQKLFKYFISHYNPNSIVSYCDLSKFEGNVYSKLGMTLAHESDPNYHWVRFNEVYTRYQTQKHNLPKLLGKSFDFMLSEADNMINNGFVKIYDCGNAVYEWRK